MDIFRVLHEHIAAQLAAIQAQLDRIETAITKLSTQEHKDMTATDDAITALTAEVSKDTDVVSSSTTAITTLVGLYNAAIAAAGNLGATPAQLAALTALDATMQANNGIAVSNLAAATAAGTVAAP